MACLAKASLYVLQSDCFILNRCLCIRITADTHKSCGFRSIYVVVFYALSATLFFCTCSKLLKHFIHIVYEGRISTYLNI
jgi:hypothetical protein